VFDAQTTRSPSPLCTATWRPAMLRLRRLGLHCPPHNRQWCFCTFRGTPMELHQGNFNPTMKPIEAQSKPGAPTSSFIPRPYQLISLEHLTQSETDINPTTSSSDVNHTMEHAASLKAPSRLTIHAPNDPDDPGVFAAGPIPRIHHAYHHLRPLRRATPRSLLGLDRHVARYTP